MATTLHLVRHGEVENPKGVIYGRLPGYHLSERGRAQAKLSAERLSDADIAAIWASPLERAQETATAIAEPHGLKLVTDARLIESDTTLETFGRTITTFMRSMVGSPRHWWQMRNPLRPSWGEAYSAIQKRMLEAIDEALAANEGREVVVVSHQSPVRLARAALVKSRVPAWIQFAPCHTGSVSTLVIEGGSVTSASYFAPQV